MKKIIIATHGNMAEGLKDTLEFLVGKMNNLYIVTAYVNDVDIDKEIGKLMENDDEIYVLTDLMAGSVTQKFYKYMSNNIHIISGINLPLALTIAIQINTDNEIKIERIIKEAKEQIVYVNKSLLDISNDDE
ncbi:MULTISPECIES: PTS sugar transporter subunit IIA [Clostridium]|jgi:fructoselysine/glucoselysine PTS system EIIA component|uniref:PTS sugar transporter subunit IIA n=1 Tax=Clostridium TaxID=1485 RepID=UPI001158FC51|nr:PTS fructose transporter subunit IIA [Clostridium sp.]MDU1277420.1 PTS N-acetylglucosamine transporter subunit IIBC [Clostridium sp.]MDU3349712.1 PTS N-acetylglucosamine transporter subunit IIBC [Clostridium sp.]MDU3408145.1 PTS N-acetylglucosamine transporter subunit IIBC [Clostridium sp.]MDU3524454.1 PTS N-acetylglucosamine transporter subunit IIBC [Clostridium sp.]MDU7087057.1 PTS N-acetylglucosamine transporter subunit IIBC [Clostridium sp.]